MADTEEGAVLHSLRNHDFTRGLADKQVAALLPLCSKAAFEQDDLVLAQGQRSHYFYLVLTGSVVVELHRPLFAVRLQAVGPNQAFGWSALLDHQDTLFQVRAREQTRALRLDGPRLLEMCRADTNLGVEILNRALEVVAVRIRATEMRFAELCGVSVDPGLPDLNA